MVAAIRDDVAPVDTDVPGLRLHGAASDAGAVVGALCGNAASVNGDPLVGTGAVGAFRAGRPYARRPVVGARTRSVVAASDGSDDAAVDGDVAACFAIGRADGRPHAVADVLGVQLAGIGAVHLRERIAHLHLRAVLKMIGLEGRGVVGVEIGILRHEAVDGSYERALVRAIGHGVIDGEGRSSAAMKHGAIVGGGIAAGIIGLEDVFRSVGEHQRAGGSCFQVEGRLPQNANAGQGDVRVTFGGNEDAYR